jgi:hypothetical protein
MVAAASAVGPVSITSVDVAPTTKPAFAVHGGAYASPTTA